jgi:hypothetical protein
MQAQSQLGPQLRTAALQSGRRARAGGLTEQSWQEGLAELTTLLARSRAEWKIVIGAPELVGASVMRGAVAVLAPACRAACTRDA